MSQVSAMKPEPNIQQNPFMTSSDVVEFLDAHGIRISSACLQKWRASGDGPRFVRLTDKARAPVLYPASSVSEWLDERLSMGSSKRQEAAHG